MTLLAIIDQWPKKSWQVIVSKGRMLSARGHNGDWLGRLWNGDLLSIELKCYKLKIKWPGYMYLLRGERFEEFYIHDLTKNTLQYDHSVADRKLCKLVCIVFSLIQFLKYDTTSIIKLLNILAIKYTNY